MSDTSKRKHYHDIDGARSVLMFLSVALHAGTVYAPARPWITTNLERHEFFDWLIFGLHLFITPTFFFVGGFFTVLLLKRRTISDFLWNRALRTAVPLVTIAVTLNAVEHYFRYVDTGGQLGPLGWISSSAFATVLSSGTWQLHLWFLVSLLPMFLLSAIIHRALPKNSLLRQHSVTFSAFVGKWIARPVVFPLFLLLLAVINLANLGLASAVPGSYDLLFPGFQSWYKLTREFPFFVVGVMAALSPKFLQSICAWRAWMPYAAAAALFFQPYASPDQSFTFSVVMLFLNQLVMWTIVLFILQFFHRYCQSSGPRISWFADCALSMYLIHHCFVYMYGRVLVDVNWPIWLEFILLTGVTALTVIIIHEFLIRRFYLFRLLFNGKTDVPVLKANIGKNKKTGLSSQ